MQFTQIQVRTAMGFSPETLRHWRSVIPYLKERQGRQANFSFGDLVSLAVLRCLVDDLGLGIGQFSESAEHLFGECNNLIWIGRTDASVLVKPKKTFSRPDARREPPPVSVSIVRDGPPNEFEGATIIVQLDPIAAALREQLFGTLPDADSTQPWLPLPLTEVSFSRK